MIGPGKTAFKKLKILLDRMMLRRTKVCFFFKFDHGFPPWRLLGTKSRWSGFATEKNCCSLWLLQLRGEGALFISVWKCVQTIQHLCWSGNCAQQCVKRILYSQITWPLRGDRLITSSAWREWDNWLVTQTLYLAARQLQPHLSPRTPKRPPVHCGMILQRMRFNPNAITSSTILDLFYRWLSA